MNQNENLKLVFSKYFKNIKQVSSPLIRKKVYRRLSRNEIRISQFNTTIMLSKNVKPKARNLIWPSRAIRLECRANSPIAGYFEDHSFQFFNIFLVFVNSEKVTNLRKKAGSLVDFFKLKAV